MNKETNLVQLTQEYVFDLFKQLGTKQLVYHNYNHTLEVVKAALELGIGLELDDNEIELVQIAAWFHDTGYIKKYKGHEAESLKYAISFLENNGVDEAKIKIISNAILATKFPQKPKTKLEEILCDADFSHFGKKEYLDKCKLLRLEWELMNQFPEDDIWPESEIIFLAEHKYHTEFAQREYANRKGKNILSLKEIQIEQKSKRKKEKEKNKKEKNKRDTPERGIETMFRVSLKNHMTLSDIADNKANIMLSINAIIISISLSTLIPNFDTNPNLIIPSIILLFVCIVTIIFATLSTRPKISEGKFTREDVRQHIPNLLFFGNFHGMPFSEFEWGMKEMMQQKDYLYGAMIKDFYSLGSVLAKKYKYLRVCYGIFMYGMIASVVAFLISFLVS